MPQLARANPHLRLTAAILVAVFAALAGSLEADPSARGRRGECQTVVGGIRLVAVRSGAVHDHQRAALPSVPHSAAPSKRTPYSHCGCSPRPRAFVSGSTCTPWTRSTVPQRPRA